MGFDVSLDHEMSQASASITASEPVPCEDYFDNSIEDLEVCGNGSCQRLVRSTEKMNCLCRLKLHRSLCVDTEVEEVENTINSAATNDVPPPPPPPITNGALRARVANAKATVASMLARVRMENAKLATSSTTHDVPPPPPPQCTLPLYHEEPPPPPPPQCTLPNEHEEPPPPPSPTADESVKPVHASAASATAAGAETAKLVSKTVTIVEMQRRRSGCFGGA